MPDLVATVALHFSIVFAFALVLSFGLKRAVKPVPLVLGLASALIYFFAVMLVGGVQAKMPMLADLQFNWSGKVIAIALTLTMMVVFFRNDRKEVGLTLRQEAGSIVPSLVVAIALCCFSWGIRWIFGGGATPSAERLIYQATMPGLDEELFYRGLLLALFLRAFQDRMMIAGAVMGPAAIVTTFLFAAGHALAFRQGELIFDPIILGFTAVLGLGFIWIRQRTGSLLLPVIVHNVINFGGSFMS